MKYNSAIYVLLLLLCFNVFFAADANAQECAWARSAGGGRNAQPTAVVTDASGNVYVTGSYSSDTMYFGTSYIVNTDSFSNNIYLAKYDSAGSLLWVKSFGGTDDDYVNGMAIDNSGKIYITGTLSSPSVTFGPTTITSVTGSIFLARLDTDGNVLWAKSAAGVSSEADAVTTDVSGNVFITGSYQDTITIGTTLLTHTPFLGSGVFVAKYDALGNNIWAVSSDGAGDDGPATMAVDASGNIYVTGSWTSTNITFDTITVTNTAPDNNVFFLTKYNASGNALWVRSTGDSNFVGGTSLGIDASGNVYVGGAFSSPTVTFGSTTLTNADPTASSNDIFLVKYTTAGNVIWAKGFGGTSEDGCNAIFVDPSGSIYMAGMFESASITFGATALTNFGMYLAGVNSSGSVLWAKGASALSSSSATSVFMDAFNHLYTTGSYNTPTLTLDAVTLTDPGSPFLYMFLARYDNVSTGVAAIIEKTLLSIYPNPASTFLNINAHLPINQITITSLLGQTVYTQNYNANEVQVDVSALPSGVYFVKVNDSEVRKFVKE